MAPSVGQLAAGQGVAWDDLGTLSTVFPIKHLKASEDQESPTWLLNKLQQLVAALKDQAHVAALWPGLTPSQLAHLSATMQLLHEPGPELHVKLLQKFGCALLPLMPASAAAALQPDHVALYLMLPDSWTFKTHSYPSVTQFASHSSSTSRLYVGTVAAAQYSSLIDTMDTIIKQQENLKAEDKKTGQKMSHFQRKPAFIESVIKAALLHLPAESEASANAGNEGSSLFGKRGAAQELLAWRGRLHLLARSDLDRACNQQLPATQPE
ncbi:hypothetical protein OEZ86_000683 [Tetradesmus obliquus]|nr:hypothetical protein OEZ86_000683 [Tetradesmus obliquus]